MKLLRRRRNVPPGIYNTERLNESPVPQHRVQRRARCTSNTNTSTNTQDPNESTANQSLVDSTAQNAQPVITTLDATSVAQQISLSEEE